MESSSNAASVNLPACCGHGTVIMHHAPESLRGIAEASGPAIRSYHP